MLEKICRFIEENNMLSSGDTVVCGLSGGADSVCLLLVLNELSQQLGITVEAIHVNHSLRGAESDRDESFCKCLCEKYGIRFTAERVDVNAFAQMHSLSCEEAARKLRYEIFSAYSQRKKIATAHNANDNLETIILNLARGSGLKGLTGIPPIRGNIVRPLLEVNRCEIEDFLKSRNQDFVTDSTNLTEDYTRNKIRHRIIPMLEEINSSVVKTTVRSSETLRDENSFITDSVREAAKKCRSGNSFTGLEKYHKVIRRRCIAELLSENGLPYSNDRLTECDRILCNGGKIDLNGTFYFISDGKTVGITIIDNKKTHTEISSELIIGENSIFPDIILECRIVNCDNLRKIKNVHKNLTFYYLDYDKIFGRAVIRNRRFGDKIQLCGRNFTSSVKKLINEKVSAELRNTLHFIEDEKGTIFAEAIGVADRVRPDESTVRLLEINIKRI
ncbi:MAG: tRNA lysidine(34) synthetase TilS [Ruminococcus sp.]|nr:tRNA lysidine(34) synthetase TilS [Ruminococcus sp.]